MKNGNQHEMFGQTSQYNYTQMNAMNQNGGLLNDYGQANQNQINPMNAELLKMQQMQQMQQMQMNMPMNVLIAPGSYMWYSTLANGTLKTWAVKHNTLNFIGNAIQFQERINSLSSQDFNSIVDAQIIFTGNKIKEPNKGCAVIPYVLGCFIFPLFITCTDCYKKCINPAWEVNSNAYALLQKLTRAPKLQNLSLTVIDNLFDKNKAQLVFNCVSNSHLRGFTFVNSTVPYNFQNGEYSDFVQNMTPIKNLKHVVTELRWFNTLVK